MKKSQIPIAKPIIGRDVRKAVNRVLRSSILTQGPEVLAFENEFSLLVNERECVAVNSGTSALHLALLSLGIGAGDEVIVPSFTFAATANSVALTGATPVFVDIDLATYNVDPTLIEAAITSSTKAIQVVHLYGLPADMIAIMQIARKHNLLVIEDAAQAHTASINGQPVGTFGDAAAFSFYPTKNITSGEGGMIVFKEKAHARLSRLYRNQGMEKRYQNELVGFNLRMTDIHAAIGRAQLKHLLKWSKKRQDNAMALSKQLENVATPIVPIGFSHVFHQYTIRVSKNRDIFAEKLTQSGIGNSVYYPTPVHKLPAFSSSLSLPQTQIATESVLSLPVHPSLSKGDLKRIASTVNELTKVFNG
jgi:dTDP-4-amino-4,6-dideoxygalactose transaminase